MRRLHPCLFASQVQRLQAAASQDHKHISHGHEQFEQRPHLPHHAHNATSLGSKGTAEGADGASGADPSAGGITPPTPATPLTPAPCLVLRVRESGGHFGSPDDQATELMEDYAFLLKHAHGVDA